MKKTITQQQQNTQERLAQLIGNTEESKNAPVPAETHLIQQAQKQLKPAPVTIKDKEYYSNLLGIKMIPTKGKHLGFKAPLNFALITQRQFDVFEQVKEIQNKYNDTLIGTIIDLLLLGLKEHKKIENKTKK